VNGLACLKQQRCAGVPESMELDPLHPCGPNELLVLALSEVVGLKGLPEGVAASPHVT
jgi:hypothetical protein